MAEEKFISKYTANEIESMLDKVKNDMRVIQFTQSEINTLLGKIQNMTQPTKTSDLTNDSGFITNVVNDLVNYYTKTQTYTKEEVNALVSQATSGGFEPVSVLPTENISTSKIYLVPNAAGLANNIKDEYINLDGTSNGWELIGSTALDLSNYVSVTALDTALVNYLTSDSFNTQIANYYNKTEIAGLLTDKIDNNKIGAANGVASLDNNGKVPSSQLPEYQNSNVSNTGFTPIGAIIPLMGTTAPRHYLACNGQIINISDYPELADYFEEQFGSKNKFGGDGTTTFAVPDLRGEFLRGTGTNSHTNQGSGATVGTHQDSELPNISGFVTDIPFAKANGAFECTYTSQYRPPFNNNAGNSWFRQLHLSGSNSSSVYKDNGEARPTNTSVLYCIATKNIYVDARFDYSIQEKVIGTWIDGKPLYQKTINVGAWPNNSNKDVSTGLSNITVRNAYGYGYNPTEGTFYVLPLVTTTGTNYVFFNVRDNGQTIRIGTNTDRTSITVSYITLQYTKTV